MIGRKIYLLKRAVHATGISERQHVGWNVGGDYASRPNRDVVTDRDSGKDD
jgi:hypothetical protein